MFLKDNMLHPKLKVKVNEHERFEKKDRISFLLYLQQYNSVPQSTT